MEIAVMEGAEWDDVFVADLLAHAAALGEAEVMSVGWLAIADEARKLAHSLQMLFVADPPLEA